MSAEKLGTPTLPQPPLTPERVRSWCIDLHGRLSTLLRRMNDQGNWSVPIYGVWTPAITAVTTPGTPTYSAQLGRYTLMGDDVWLWGRVTLSAWEDSPVGTVHITGLPWASHAGTPRARGVCALANVTLKELFYSPLTVKLGRQNLWYGRGMIVGSRILAGDVDPDNNLGSDEFSQNNGFDAVRAILDFNPVTVDLLYSKVDENALNAAKRPG